jgi:hypothetical protein
MVFRLANGSLIILNKYDCKNDKVFYQKVYKIQTSFTKSLESQEK